MYCVVSDIFIVLLYDLYNYISTKKKEKKFITTYNVWNDFNI